MFGNVVLPEIRVRLIKMYFPLTGKNVFRRRTPVSIRYLLVCRVATLILRFVDTGSVWVHNIMRHVCVWGRINFYTHVWHGATMVCKWKILIIDKHARVQF